MTNPITFLAALPLLAAAPAPPSVHAMRHDRRVLIVAAPSPADPRLAEQRRALAGWRQGAADRDITLVEVVGDHVAGAGDAAATLRRTWRLPARDFAVVLVGKDGHEALRHAAPLPAEALQQTVDAMPMRRAGLR
jgi:hypothetical protein